MAAQSQIDRQLKQLLPQNAKGYRPRGPARTYTSETLFDLIDGGAEVYLALNVAGVINCVYEKKDSADIIVDIFDMQSSADAFGAYRHDIREAEDVGVGNESEYQGGSLFFWKGKYFVSIVALEQSPSSKRAAIGIGRKIAANIKPAGRGPELLELLPRKGLDRSQLHYFHLSSSLERFYQLNGNNPLGLNAATEGILARFAVGARSTPPNKPSKPATLLAIRYPSAKSARQALTNLYERHFSQTISNTPVELGDRQWAMGCHYGTLLIAVLNAPNPKTAERLLTRASQNAQTQLQEQDHEKRPKKQS